MRDEAETRIVDTFYRGVLDDTALQQAVGLVANHFDSPSACLGEADIAHGTWMMGSGPVDGARLKQYARISAIDPAPRAFSAIRVCTASTSDRLYSERERTRSAFVNEYMRPAGLDHSMGSPLYLDARRFALIGVHQASRRRRFDDDDIASLERLSPHVARTLQLRRSFLDLRRKEKTFEAFVEDRDTGLIGCSGNGTLFVNRAARAMAATCDGFKLDRNGRPVIHDSTASARVARLEGDVLSGGHGGIARVPRPSGAEVYVILVSRLPGGDGTIGEEIGVLYSIYDPGRRKRSTDAMVGDVLGIPRGPAKVVAALLEGHDLQSYAEAAGITVNTVRCHLKSAFALTSTHSQSELVRSALSALGSLDIPATLV